MKSMNDHNSCGGNNNNNANNSQLLGFSLSPTMKMDAYTATSAPTSFYHSLSPLHSSGLCYSVGEMGAFHSPLSAMPLKSDGSLCIMEAFSRSQTRSMLSNFYPLQKKTLFFKPLFCWALILGINTVIVLYVAWEGMVPNSSPKLEDFLGGATMGDGQYGSHEREAGILSLDSIYYTPQDVEQEAARQRSLGFHQEPQNHHSYYSNLQCHGFYLQPLEGEPKLSHQLDCGTQIAQMPGNELKNWASVELFGQQAPEQQQIATTTTTALGCNELQPLSLSMSPGSQSSCVTAARQISPTDLECVAMDCKKRASGKVAPKQPTHRKSLDTFGQRTSQYRGVTRSIQNLVFKLHFPFSNAVKDYLLALINDAYIMISSDIGGQVGMRPIFGITVARRKGRLGKGGKVSQSMGKPQALLASFLCSTITYLFGYICLQHPVFGHIIFMV